MKKNNNGFSVIEFVMLLVIVGLIGFIGYYVWHTKNNTDKNLNSAASTSSEAASKKAVTASGPYAGWKQYCSTQEKACFKYPTEWTLDTSASSPDQDRADVTAPNGSAVSFFSAIAGLGGACDPDTTSHVYIHKVVALPNVSGLNIVEYGNQTSTVTVGVTDNSVSTGDTGECLFYATFLSKDKSRGQMLIGSHRVDDTTGNVALSASEITTIELILKSYSYN